MGPHAGLEGPAGVDNGLPACGVRGPERAPEIGGALNGSGEYPGIAGTIHVELPVKIHEMKLVHCSGLLGGDREGGAGETDDEHQGDAQGSTHDDYPPVVSERMGVSARSEFRL